MYQSMVILQEIKELASVQNIREKSARFVATNNSERACFHNSL